MRRYRSHLLPNEPSEAASQAALIAWRDMLAPRYPNLGMLFAIPNGGLRSKREAARLVAEGVRAGVPDLILLVPRRGYHALLIEMKTSRGVLSPEQRAFLSEAANRGYLVTVCRSWPEAAAVLCSYLDLPPELAPPVQDEP